MHDSAIIIISHSQKIAEGILELIQDFTPSVPVLAFGGLDNGQFGSDYNNIYNSIINTDFKRYYCFYDLGSSKLNLKILQQEVNKNLIILDAPLIEGSFRCAVGISIDTDPSVLKTELVLYQINK